MLQKYMNKIQNNKILAGQKLKIYSDYSVNDLQTRTSRNTTKKTAKIHTVRKGETLFSIATNYNLSVDKLKSVNRISDNKIMVGQKIRLE